MMEARPSHLISLENSYTLELFSYVYYNRLNYRELWLSIKIMRETFRICIVYSKFREKRG